MKKTLIAFAGVATLVAAAKVLTPSFQSLSAPQETAKSQTIISNDCGKKPSYVGTAEYESLCGKDVVSKSTVPVEPSAPPIAPSIVDDLLNVISGNKPVFVTKPTPTPKGNAPS